MPKSNFSVENLTFHAPKSEPNTGDHPPTSGTNILFCKFCPGTSFHSQDDFCFHLRNAHCSKEGGSYVCRYGRNNVCQMLPIEGVSDEDYEQHIRRLHADPDYKIEMEDYSDDGDEELAIASINKFNVNSFTQNLSSVLADPKRSKTETLTFFTRHWGDQFIPRVSVTPASSIPKITVEHFRQYLTTTAKKHRQYLRAKRALKKALARHAEQTCIDPDELPTIFLNPKFSLNDPEIFKSVFLEPNTSETDKLVSEAEKKRSTQVSSRPGTSNSSALSRQGSITSLISTQSLQPHVLIDAGSGQYFRPYQFLHNRLEFFHDTVGSMLNHQLESKNEAFWKTVNSYGTLHGHLEDAKSKIGTLRTNLRTVDKVIYDRLQKILKLHQARENREKMLHKLEDIACLRDAQSTVQMLLNQNDYPKALECIETAQEVLSSDLRGVICFRHLSSQLQELHKVIAKMLHEEFVTLIQKEFGKPLEKESEIAYQEGQLPAVIQGLLRCKEYKFIQVIKGEIVEAVKNSLRQIIKNRIVECGAELTEFDPSLGNLGDQMRKMNFDQWLDTLRAVFNSLWLLCKRVQSIQELILENAQRVQEKEQRRSASTNFVNAGEDGQKVEKIEKSEKITIPTSMSSISLQTLERKLSDTSLASATSMPPSIGLPSSNNTDTNPDQNSISSKFLDVEVDRSNSGTPNLGPSAASLLSMPIRDINQLKSSALLLVEHTAYSTQERSSKLLVARSKDGFLEKSTPDMFHEVEETVKKYVDQLDNLVASIASGPNGPISPSPPQIGRSPLLSTLQNETTKFITRFHELKRQKLGNILDSEQWKTTTEVPRLFQKMIDEFEKSGKLKDVISRVEGGTGPDPPTNGFSTLEPTQPIDYLMVDNEKYYVVSTSLLLLRMMAQYCDLLELFPQCVSELLLHMIELLKNFNSRTCQLILGAGALQLVGLKTISVKNLALAARCLQLISRFIPVIRTEFEEVLPPERKNQLRYFDQTIRDYQDHINEINNKLVSVLEFHLVSGLNDWEINGQIPSAAFQQIVRQIGKFYNGFATVMSQKNTNEMLVRVHGSFKSHLKQVLQARSITPYDPLTYGLVSQDFAYYIENMKSLPYCQEFPDDSLSDVLNAA